MQDAYVGNLGDFAKYSLLRALTNWPEKSEEALPLHMVWFRVRNNTRDSEFWHRAKDRCVS